MHFTRKIIQSIIILLIFNHNIVFGKTQKKELDILEIQKVNESTITSNKTNVPVNASKILENSTEINQINIINKDKFPNDNLPYINKSELPNSYVFAFIICISIGIIAIILISLKAYRMRRTRAERRYGVQGDRSTQELTPLPLAIEDDESDFDDDTLFDRNRIT